MIIATFNANPTINIDVSLWPNGPTTEPFIVRFANGNSVHMSLSEAQRLHTQLTAAMYEYDTDYKFRETA